MDGPKVADNIRASLKETVDKFSKPPGLAFVSIGSRAETSKFAEKKKQAFMETGIVCFSIQLPGDTSQKDVLEKLKELNKNKEVHGIHLELPLPSHLNEEVLRRNMDPDKDVDGMHPLNFAKLCQTYTRVKNENDYTAGPHLKSINFDNLAKVPFPLPPTAEACIELLDAYDVTIKGKTAVVVGRSNAVATPVARLLVHRDATVTIVHKKTQNASSIVKQADILIAAAISKPNAIKASWIKRGCVIIDVGINRVANSSSKNGYVLVGDVDHEGARRVAWQMTPIGAMGPMTIAMLLRNTVDCFKRQQAALLRASF